MTARQVQVFDFIAGFIQQNRRPPVFREIGAGVGVTSLGTVHKHVYKLQRAGVLKVTPNVYAGIALTAKGKKLQKVQP